jgi:hypothetical protein
VTQIMELRRTWYTIADAEDPSSVAAHGFHH